jgi:asparagine synthase (glutamine-hydrolysing)
MKVGFAVVAQGHKVEFQLFGDNPSNRPLLVSYASASDVRAVLMGRLYYRDELRERLRQAGNPQPPQADAELVLESYRQFGQDGIERLEGDFALVVWDRAKRRLYSSREAMGGYPIYWLHRGETVAIATGLRPLVELLPGHSLNLDFLGEMLMLPNMEIDYFEGTVFDGIRRLVPGWSIDVDLAQGAVARREFWKWPQRIVSPGNDRPTDIAAHYGELLRRSVRERLRGCMAAHFSGGMDSTSVALLAAEELHRQGRSLHALSLVYRDLSNLDAETPYLEEALKKPGIVPHRIDADDILDYDFFRDMPLHDEPISGLYRFGLQAALVRKAVEVGADTVFTGLGADEALAVEPFYIADLLRRGSLATGCVEASRWAEAQNTNAWWILCRYGLGPLMPAWTQAGIKAFFRGGYADWKGQNFFTIGPWVQRDFARRAQLRSRALEHQRQRFKSSGSVVNSEALATARYFCGDSVRYTLSAPVGIVDAHPFRDLRVFSYGLGIRANVRPVPGVQKPILAEAMRDILPASIRQRRLKTHYNSVYYTGLARNQVYLEELIRASTVDELGLFDKECLLGCLREAALGVSSQQGSISLDNTLSIIKWLDLLPQWLARRPEPVRVIHSDSSETPVTFCQS